MTEKQGRVHFRQARAGDARAIRRLIYQVGINPFGLDWRRFLLAVDEQDRMLGCGQIKPHQDGSFELASIAVVPGQQGQGIGSQIILRLLETAPRPIYLTCRSGIGSYYERFGFRQIPLEQQPPFFRRLSRLAAWLTRLFLGAGELWVMVKSKG